MTKYLVATAALASLGFLVNCFFTASVTAKNNFAGVNTELLFRKIVENRNFIVDYEGSSVLFAPIGFLVNYLSAASMTAESNFAKAKTNLLLKKIVENRGFFINYKGNGVNDYEKSLLCDVSDLGGDRIGLLLLEPSGFLKSLVFYRGTGVKIHEDATIPAKGVRNELARSGISIPDARLVAQNIAGFSVDLASDSSTKETGKKVPRKKVTPQTLPVDPEPIDAEKVLQRLREEVARNSEVSAMDSREIIRRFRSETQGAKAPK